MPVLCMFPILCSRTFEDIIYHGEKRLPIHSSCSARLSFASTNRHKEKIMRQAGTPHCSRGRCIEEKATCLFSRASPAQFRSYASKRDSSPVSIKAAVICNDTFRASRRSVFPSIDGPVMNPLPRIVVFLIAGIASRYPTTTIPAFPFFLLTAICLSAMVVFPRARLPFLLLYLFLIGYLRMDSVLPDGKNPRLCRGTWEVSDFPRPLPSFEQSFSAPPSPVTAAASRPR